MQKSYESGPRESAGATARDTWITEFLQLLEQLYRRPRIGTGLGAERGVGRKVRGLPIVWLRRDPQMRTALFPAIKALLSDAHPYRIPHALYSPETQPDAAAPDGPAPWAQRLAGETGSWRMFGLAATILANLSVELAAGRNARSGRLRFRRFRLAYSLLSLDLTSSSDREKELRRELRGQDVMQRSVERALAASQDPALPVGRPGSPWQWLLRLFPLILLPARMSGRVPGLSGTYRWFLRQPFLTPADPGTFTGFAERLTIPARRSEDPDEMLRLLVNAFLQDLRTAYGRLAWLAQGARRTTYVIALLDQITASNGGHKLLDALSEVRNQVGRFDPLLLAAATDDLPPSVLGRPGLDEGSLLSPQRRFNLWKDQFDEARRARRDTAWYLVIETPTNLTAQMLDAPETGRADALKQTMASIRTLSLDPPPLWSRRWVPALAASLALAAGALTYADWNQGWNSTHCDTGVHWPIGRHSDLRSSGGECFGVSDGSYLFQNADLRLPAVEQVIDAQNRQAQAQHALQPSRPYLTLVYLAALTSPESNPDDLVAEREELEGAAVAQQQQLKQLGQSNPIVKILIANGGDRMDHGTDTVAIIKSLSEQDPTLVGVVGLNESRQATLDTIGALSRAGLPMIAVTLSADKLATTSPLYFQVSPQNRREAAVAIRQITATADSRHIPQAARRLIVYYSGDPSDVYSSNLAADLRAAAAAAVGPLVTMCPFVPSASSFQPAACSGQQGSDRPLYNAVLAGSDACRFTAPGDVVYFAGRGIPDFGDFLKGIEASCHDNPPAILADDDVTRYVADLELRRQYPDIRFQYESFAIAPESSCGGNEPSAFYAALDQQFAFECTPSDGRSLDGHAALAYDATSVMITAVERLRDSGQNIPITPAAVWREITDIHTSTTNTKTLPGALDGATGEIDFGGQIDQHVPLNKPVVILTVQGAGQPTSPEICGKISGNRQASWCPPPETATP